MTKLMEDNEKLVRTYLNYISTKISTDLDEILVHT